MYLHYLCSYSSILFCALQCLIALHFIFCYTNNKGGGYVDFEKSAKRNYYNSLPSDYSITFRLPKQLKEDFVKISSNGPLAGALKNFMIDTILYHSENSKDTKE